ncbi:hypothetical protein BST81_22380 [Leptolyngbya sp. 'hensonii']|uniref:GGDEF domain-containing protein n=1 Tax=Leptolyngbya sp. 'hensonii' TaxID=1922337 RepID=UPI00094FF33C|nr:GGDEF domain-containing protein [Leptolyngbya sp. 'hensonii']OLP16153.1 hypothetical protein BST81_22380 [Leptolyngbya sp. 'hensonii']
METATAARLPVPSTQRMVFFRLASESLAIVVVLIGLAMLLGWIADLYLFKGFASSWPTIKTNTVLTFILGGLSLWLWHQQGKIQHAQSKQIMQWLNLTAAAVLVIIAVLTLTQYGFHVDLGLDQVLLPQPNMEGSYPSPEQVAPDAVIASLLLGSAMLILNIQQPNYLITQVLGVAGWLIAFLGFLGYGDAFLHHAGLHTGMTLPAAINFLLLGTSIVFARPDRGIMLLISGEGQGSLIARQVMPIAILAPPLIGKLCQLGYTRQLYSAEAQVAVQSILVTLVMGSVILKTTRTLNQIDLQNKQAETALWESRQRLELALEGSGEGLWDWNLKTGEAYFSPRWLDMLGYASDDLPKHIRAWESLIHPDDKPWVMDILKAHLENHAFIYQFEYRLRTQAGEWKWIANYGKVVAFDRDGSPLRMSGTHRDVHDRKLIDELLHQQAQENKALIEHSPDIIIRWDRCFQPLYVNPVIEQKTGISASRFMHNTAQELGLPQPLVDLWQAAGQKVFDTGQEQTLEFAYPSPTQLAYYHARLVPESSGNGSIDSVLMVCRDVTELKQIEGALRQSELTNKAMMQAIPDLLIRMHRNGTYLQVFRSSSFQLFKPQKSKAGANVYNILPPELAEKRMQYTHQALATGELQVYEHQLTIGEDFHYEEVRITVCGEDEVLVMVRDITDRKQAEAALQTANGELERLATIDSLTGLANRRSFDLYLQQEWQRAQREKTTLSLLLCDIDYFKLYNDSYGHQIGDTCLIQVAQAIKQAVKRSTDLAARYGGEEFVVILPHTTTAGAIAVAEAITNGIQLLTIDHRASPISQYVTASVGIATVVPSQELTTDRLIATADQALYEAKRLGRNRYCSAALFP